MLKRPLVLNDKWQMTKRPIRSASNHSVYKIFIKINLIDFNVDFYTVQKPYDQSLHHRKKLHFVFDFEK